MAPNAIRAMHLGRRRASRRLAVVFIAAASLGLATSCRERREIQSEGGGAVDATIPASGASVPLASRPDAAPPRAVAAPPAPLPTPPDAARIRLEDPALDEWIEARVASAKKGAPERVRIPLVRHGSGWGCVCPPYYVGTNPSMGQGPWLEVTFPRGVRALREGEIVYAEGSFGGARKHVHYPSGPEPSGDWEYDLIPFAVTTTSPMVDDPLDSDISLELLGHAR